MKKSITILASLLAVLFVSNSVNATVPTNPTATASAEATANIVQPLEISKIADLAFGNIAAGTTDGTVTIATDGSRIGDGGLTLIAAGNVSNAADFSITGYPNATFTIDLPASIDIESNGNVMTVDNFVSSLGANSTLDAQGEGDLSVGATLNVNANQTPGLYSGSFDVIVAYN